MTEITVMDLLRPHVEKKEALKRIDYSKQHARGRLSASERVALLFDPDSFVEIGALAQQDQFHRGIKPEPTPRDGVIAGYGTVKGRRVGVGAYDFTVKGGSMGFVGEWKLTRIKRLVMEQGFPLVIFCDGTGARLEEEVTSKAGYDNPQFADLCSLSGYVPIVVAIMGECFGGHANLTALGDFVPMTRDSTMGLVGPPLLKSKMNIEISKEELGGVAVHCDESGMADLAVKDDRECIERIKEFLSYLPSNCHEESPAWETEDDPNRREGRLLEIVPTNPKRPYDMREIIGCIVDEGRYFELKPTYARNMITCLSRMDGRVVGIIANQPLWLAGAIDVKACIKASHFVNLCDAFGIALIYLQDVPGFLPGPTQEREGIIRWSTRMLFELAHATVPRITILIRKAYGLAHYGMCNLGFRPNMIVAWPTGEFSAIDPEDAVDIMFGKQLAGSEDRERARTEMIQAFKRKTGLEPVIEASLIDDVIDPRDTRPMIIKALKMARKRRKGLHFKKRSITPI
ncbi:MAG: carboxyl transferase domain-containing protein [Pseudomonadota bacterium]